MTLWSVEVIQLTMDAPNERPEGVTDASCAGDRTVATEDPPPFDYGGRHARTA
jgi:hypothetical protein